jgi:hypothetical protein
LLGLEGLGMAWPSRAFLGWASWGWLGHCGISWRCAGLTGMGAREWAGSCGAWGLRAARALGMLGRADERGDRRAK